MARLCSALLLFVLLASPVMAQPEVVASVKAELVARGVSLVDSCGGFQITKRVAWRLRATGAGLLSKPSGNQCEGYAVDIVAFSDGRIVDILTDAGGANGPTWGPGEPVEASRWRPAVDPGDTPPVVVPPVVVPPYQPPVQTDLGPIYQRFDDNTARLERMFEQWQLAEQAERIRDAALADKVDHPGWFKQVFGNRYVQMILAGTGTWVGQKVAK